MIPLKRTTLDGLAELAQLGVQPDLIYLDAEHSYEAVTAELESCLAKFPGVTLIGDDYDDPEVQSAVHDFAAKHKVQLDSGGSRWRAWKLVLPEKQQQSILAPALTSIVMVTHNQAQYTQECITSLHQQTDKPYELIVVDNASQDDTLEFLQADPEIKLIKNQENLGFPAAANQGIREATGEFVLLLNNDTIVSKGWLSRMLAHLHQDDQVGMVGPCSNFVSGPQQIPTDYQDLSELDAFAQKRYEQFAGCTTETDRLVGFCLLIRCSVLDQIGLLDERFGIGNFEDDDLCLRVRQAGYRCLIAEDVFVHHYGGVSFRNTDIDFQQLLKTNQQIFQQKWHRPVNHHSAPLNVHRQTRPKFQLREGPDHALRLEHNNIRLSLCMIVRNNAAIIEQCLLSIRPWVDEMIVIDTGSEDDTALLAERLNARVYHHPWNESFAEARNESLKYARGEWIFWMDSDDLISPGIGRELRELVDGKHDPETLGYVVQVHCPAVNEQGFESATIVDHVKLFRNRPEIQFEFHIHEQILPSIRRLGGRVEFTDLYVVHANSDQSQQGKASKIKRDLNILQKDLAERPNHPFVLFNLGMTYLDDEQFQQAIEYLQRCVTFSDNSESHLRKAYALLVSAQMQLGRYEQAWQTCRAGLELFSEDHELLFRAGSLHHHFQRYQEAIQAYRDVLAHNSARHFDSVDQGILGFKTHHNLALVFLDIGDLNSAEQEWRIVTETNPDFPPAWNGLTDLFLQTDRFGDVEQLLVKLERFPQLNATRTVIAARLAKVQGRYSESRSLLEQQLQHNPEDLDLLHALAQLLFEHFSAEEALTVLIKLSEQDGNNAAVWHNLGIVHQKLGQHDSAIAAFQQSINLRADSTTTLFCLAQCLYRKKEETEAAVICQQILQQNPDHQQTIQLLNMCHNAQKIEST